MAHLAERERNVRCRKPSQPWRLCRDTVQFIPAFQNVDAVNSVQTRIQGHRFISSGGIIPCSETATTNRNYP
jgi:hypothetical protein